MKIFSEKPKDSKDFGESRTLRIQAEDMGEAFYLGAILSECRDGQMVHGNIPGNSNAPYIRIPLHTNRPRPEPSH